MEVVDVEAAQGRDGIVELTQGVTASGVTLFVPTSLVAGGSNNLYMIDNDTGYVVWSRTFEVTQPAATAASNAGSVCSGVVADAPRCATTRGRISVGNSTAPLRP